MEELKILIVEDDKAIYDDVYKTNIDLFNRENEEYQINQLWIQSKDEAIVALKNSENIFDGAIVDLDLIGSGGTDTSGNEVVKEIKENLRFPTFVITGTPYHISDELNVPSSVFRVFQRDEVDVMDTLDKFKTIKATGILNLLNRKGKIEELIQNIFWNHISTSLDNWALDNKRTSTEKEDSLLRYTILHMLEYLDESKIHPSEFYITRPVRENLSTGDLILLDDVLYHRGKRKVEKVFLLRIKELEEISEFKKLKDIEKFEDLSGTKKSELSKLITNSAKPYYHYIPRHSSINAGIIDFQDKYSIPVEELEQKINTKAADNFATISMPFLKDLIERYSSYYARQGSPDFDSDEIIESLIR